jgi:hypothetical protein
VSLEALLSHPRSSQGLQMSVVFCHGEGPTSPQGAVGANYLYSPNCRQVTSALGQSYAKRYKRHLEQNPHVRFFDKRTYPPVRCEVTPEEWRTQMRLADSIEAPDSPGVCWLVLPVLCVSVT